jgi:hypothetical protein
LIVVCMTGNVISVEYLRPISSQQELVRRATVSSEARKRLESGEKAGFRYLSESQIRHRRASPMILVWCHKIDLG